MSERVDRYRAAMAGQDIDALADLRHPDYACYYPQSGERFLGHDKWAEAHRDYASHYDLPPFDITSVRGGTRKAKVVKPTAPRFFLQTPIVQISDTGDLLTMEGKGMWPDGKVYHWVSIIEYRDGLVWRETQYFAEPFDPPEWRAEFVEMDVEESPNATNDWT